MNLVERFTVDRPASDVFAYLVAFHKTPEWNRAVRWSGLVTAGPVREGSVFEETRNTARGPRIERFEVVGFDVDRRLAIAAGDGSDFRWEYSLDEVGARTTVTTRLTIPLARRLPALEPLVAPIARRRFAANIRRLRGRLAGPRALGIDLREKVRLGGTDQWILVRGRDRSDPVVLVVGQGPGLPTINEAGDLRRLLRLEDDHVVVYWDQPGCGLSADVQMESVSVDGMRRSAADLIALLSRRFGTTIDIIGYSQGAAIAAMAVAIEPERVGRLVLVSPDVRAAEADAAAYGFAVDEARGRGNQRALRELERIGPPPHLTAARFSTRAAWVANFGGVSRGRSFRSLELALVRQLVTSRAYSPLALVWTVRAASRTRDLLLPDLARIDLFTSVPRLDVPMSVFLGRLDRVAPPEIAERYVDHLEAPRGASLVWFEVSAHFPQYDEPSFFRAALDNAFDESAGTLVDAPDGATDPSRARPRPQDTALGSGA